MISSFIQQTRVASPSPRLSPPPVLHLNRDEMQNVGDADGEDVFKRVEDDSLELHEQSELYGVKHQTLKNLKPVIDQLNQIFVDTQFPLEVSLHRKPDHTLVSVGEYISNHPNFDDLVTQQPQALQQGLEQLVALHKDLPNLPASKVLRQSNRYAYQILSSIILQRAAQELMEAPGHFDEVKANRLKSAMGSAVQNAEKDPELKLEAKIMRAIELFSENVRVHEGVVKTYENQDLLPFLKAEFFEPDKDAHPLIQAAQKHLHEQAKKPFENGIYNGPTSLNYYDQLACKKLALELSKEQSLKTTYFALCDLIRQKVGSVFTKHTNENHPLREHAGFSFLWDFFTKPPKPLPLSERNYFDEIPE